MKLFVAVLCVVILSGCSVTTLRCGIWENGSYVDLTNVPQDISANARFYADLCGFAYEETE